MEVLSRRVFNPFFHPRTVNDQLVNNCESALKRFLSTQILGGVPFNPENFYISEGFFFPIEGGIYTNRQVYFFKGGILPMKNSFFYF